MRCCKDKEAFKKAFHTVVAQRAIVGFAALKAHKGAVVLYEFIQSVFSTNPNAMIGRLINGIDFVR